MCLMKMNEYVDNWHRAFGKLLNQTLDGITLSSLQSPCVSICELCQGLGICKGCGRSIKEIELWSGYSDAAKASIIEKSRDRLKDLYGED